ncbi:MAG: FtsW/RodA/SpoVE family cell cycle protein, partial [Ruminococcus sp.]|nr:FtsW/RodA/SpoVE family cell cycle protein [Ruminococcus sp.]
MKSAFKNLSDNKHSVDIGLLIAIMICSVISTLLIYSISKSGISADEGVGDSYWRTQLFSMILGIGVAILLSFVDYRKIVKLWFIYAPVALLLVGLTFTSLGYQREGADDKAWLKIGSFQFQPSEILKIVFILTFAYHLSRDEEDMNRPLHMLLLCLHAGIPLAIVGKQGDYGTAIVFAIMFVFMICSAKISWKYVVIAPFIAGAGIAAMWFFALSGFHKKRI